MTQNAFKSSLIGIFQMSFESSKFSKYKWHEDDSFEAYDRKIGINKNWWNTSVPSILYQYVISIKYVKTHIVDITMHFFFNLHIFCFHGIITYRIWGHYTCQESSSDKIPIKLLLVLQILTNNYITHKIQCIWIYVAFFPYILSYPCSINVMSFDIMIPLPTTYPKFSFRGSQPLERCMCSKSGVYVVNPGMHAIQVRPTCSILRSYTRMIKSW